MDYKDLCLSVCEIARQTGSFISNELKNFNNERIEVKGQNDFVSYVDKTAEKMIVDALSVLLPESGFLAEEKTSEKIGKDYNWIIDPLDGTTNFIHGLPLFCISIALCSHDEIKLGVVYEINLDECFYAWENGAAMLNDKEIKVSSHKKLSDSLIATGFPYYDFGRMEPYMEVLKHLMQNTHGIRRLGSAAADLAYVACGRFEGFYEYSLKPWDVAAGAFIVQQAGGKVCDFKGENNWLYGQELIATNNYIYDELLNVIKSHLHK